MLLKDDVFYDELYIKRTDNNNHKKSNNETVHFNSAIYYLNPYTCNS